jgi:hypothetical protein
MSRSRFFIGAAFIGLDQRPKSSGSRNEGSCPRTR